MRPDRVLVVLGLALALLAAPARSQQAPPDLSPPSLEPLGGTVAAPAVSVERPAEPAPTSGTRAVAAPTPAPAGAGGVPAVGRGTAVDLVRDANPMLWPLVLCSVVAIGYALERLLALRRSRVVPREFCERFIERLAAGKLDRERAIELCRSHDSAAARVFERVVHHWGASSAAIRDAVSSEAASELLELKRNVRVLNGTATLAPLLGLLGTVVGLIEAFDALQGRAAQGMGKSEALAHGISLALVATAIGLGIAILSVAMYYFLLNRIDVLVRALDREATKVVDLVAGDAGRPAAEVRRPVGPPPGAGGPAAAELVRPDARGY
jgi:biopolymer transport protein ExbB